MRYSNSKMVVAVCLLFGATAEHRETFAKDKTSVSGVVKFDGPRPKRKPIRLREKRGKVSDCQKLHKTVVLDESMLVSEKGEVANVFVYVKKGLEKKSYPLPKKPAVLNQDKCMFRPRVQGVRVGQELVMRNSDPLLHNVRSLSFRNKAFNVAQPSNSEDRKWVFKKGERAVKIECDIHSWMTAYFFVMEHPYFAVTNEKGEFKIEGLPAGEYTLEAWHEEFGKQLATITVSPTRTTEVEFSFKKTDRSRRR